MQENNTKIITAKFEPDNSDSFAFFINLTSEELKRKRCYIEIIFIDGQTNNPIKITGHNEYTQFANEKSEICITAPVKKEAFTGKRMQLNVPYEIFSDLTPNYRLTAKLSLVLKEEGEAIETVSFDLMVNLGKKFTLYSLDKFAKYLKTTGSEQDKLSFAQKLLDNGNIETDVLVALLDLLIDLAQNNNPAAQYILFHLYKEKKFGMFDAMTAVSWLKKSADNGYETAIKEIEDTKNMEAIQKESDTNSIALYRKAAEDGNADAQFTMYEYCLKPGESFDEAKAASWLKLAAEDGNVQAVSKLEDFYKDSFVSAASVAEYLDIIEKAALKNCGQAQMVLFDVYFTGTCMGQNIKVDKKYAVDCLLKSANNNCYTACYKIWSLYVNGNDLLMDEETAIGWLKVAAANMIPEALNDLGDLYVEGKRILKDDAKGIESIAKAAELKNFSAQLKVYGMYCDGRYKDVLLEKDLDKAVECLISYAKDGNPLAQLKLWELYKKDNEMMFTRQEALGWLVKAESLDYNPAAYELANVCLTGEYTDVNLPKGAALLEKAAKYGDCKAQYALYQLYYQGEYYSLKTKENKERSYKWLLLSAETYHLAQHQMWVLFKSGNEMELDKNEALGYLFEAVKNGSPAAIYDIGVLYSKGDMLTKDVNKGISYIENAKKLKFPKAIYALSKIKSDGMCEGEMVEKNSDEGLRLLKLSAEYGYAPACYEIWEQFTNVNELLIEGVWAQKLLECAAAQGYAPALDAIKSLKAAG